MKMNLAQFRFYEELNEFLPEERRKQWFSYGFNGNPSIKDAIEALGIPHTEVDMILVNGNSVDFLYKMKNGDTVSVYPVFESLDISRVTHLREMSLRNPKFILDVHLGKLAKYLRLLGFDSFYDRDYDDDEIINRSISDKRIILTRDKGLLKNTQVNHGYWIRSQHPDDQLKEVILKFDLKNISRPFTRCLECNMKLIEVSKDEIDGMLMPLTRKYYNYFQKCPGCNRIFWEGTHFKRMKDFIENFNIKI